MHMIIRTIVYAKNETEALKNARTVFEKLIERKQFDYFTMFDEEGSPVSGRGRWGNITPVALATSKTGQKLITEGMDWTKGEFMRHIKDVRKALIKNDEELFNENGVDFRYPCYCIGKYGGSNIWLYDNDGEGIKTKKNLENALINWGNIKAGIKVYIVPADVHT